MLAVGTLYYSSSILNLLVQAQAKRAWLKQEP